MFLTPRVEEIFYEPNYTLIVRMTIGITIDTLIVYYPIRIRFFFIFSSSETSISTSETLKNFDKSSKLHDFQNIFYHFHLLTKNGQRIRRKVYLFIEFMSKHCLNYLRSVR